MTWLLQLGTTTCWIAAEHALQHVRNNISSVSEVFDRWKFQNSEYIVLAGFDESLIKSGVGYLEQIHVFIIAEIDATCPLLSELGRMFSPFSSILFTESSSYRLPVFKDDGSIWEFDELVHFTASKFVNDGTSAKTPLIIISLSQTPSGDGVTGSSQSSSESSSQEKGKARDMGDNFKDSDEADKDDEDAYDNPEDPPGDQDARPRGISLKITSEIIQDIQNASDSETQDKQNIFQTIIMNGGLTIEVFLYNQYQRNVVLPLNFTLRRRHWFRIHLGIQNALFNSQGFHFALSRQQTTHTSNSISGLMSIRSRGMPTLRILNQLQVQIWTRRKSGRHLQNQVQLTA